MINTLAPRERQCQRIAESTATVSGVASSDLMDDPYAF
jgi:hypothetical protein